MAKKVIRVLHRSDGTTEMLYNTQFRPGFFGCEYDIVRQSHVEPIRTPWWWTLAYNLGGRFFDMPARHPDHGKWTADMGPVKGPVLGPFKDRDEALDAEVAWLNEHKL